MKTTAAVSTTAFVLLIFLFAGASSAQKPVSPQKAAPQESLTPPLRVECQNGRIKTVTSPVLVSADGQYRAYAEIIASPTSPSDFSMGCANTSKLFLAWAKQDFKLVLMQEPQRWEAGNSLKLIDWSPNSHFLLVELSRWPMTSMLPPERTAIVIEGSSGISYDIDMGPVTAAQADENCSVDFELLGFTTDGHVTAKVHLYARESDEEEDASQKSACKERFEHWLFDFMNEKARKLPQPIQVKRYGKTDIIFQQ